MDDGITDLQMYFTEVIRKSADAFFRDRFRHRGPGPLPC